MGYIDLIVAGMIFLVVISLVFVSVGQFIPEKIDIKQSAYRNVFASLAEQVNQKTLTISSDCNSDLVDCLFFYPAQLPITQDSNVLSPDPIIAKGSTAWVVAWPSREIEVYSLDHNQIMPDYNAVALDLTFWNDQNRYFFRNSFMDVNVNDRNMLIDFFDGTGIEARLFFPNDQNFQVDFNSIVAAGIARQDGFKVQVFSKAMEAWVFMPKDKNITVDSNLIAFSAESDVNGVVKGIIRRHSWWNSSWDYRIPLSINTENNGGTDLNINLEINFDDALRDLNAVRTMDFNSIKLIEYSGKECLNYSTRGYWAFDEGTGTTASDVISANNGTLYGTPSWTTGIAGKAINFNGSTNYVDMPDNPIQHLTKWTISAWIKPLANPSPGDFDMIVFKEQLGNGGPYSIWRYDDGSIMLLTEYSSAGWKWGYWRSTANAAPLNEWTKVDYVYYGQTGSAADTKLFINGTARSTTFSQSSYASVIQTYTSLPLRVGRDSDLSSRYFQGLIDEVTLINKPLSAEEIRGNYLDENAGRSKPFAVGCNASPVHLTSLTDRGKTAELRLTLPGKSASLAGAVSYWALNEGSGSTAKDSVNGNHGIVYGSPAWVAGRVGNAINFDGLNDYVEIPNSPSVDITTNITLEAWVYPTAISSDSHNMIITKGWGAVGTRSYYLSILTGKAFFTVRNPAETAQLDLFGTTTLNTNTWYHIVATLDGSIARIYVNGIEEGNKPWSQGIRSSTSTVMLGNIGYNSLYFNGIIDEPAIYNRALSREEVRSHYIGAAKDVRTYELYFDSKLSNAVSYWTLDERGGTTANDSVNGNNGTITAATWAKGMVGNALSFNGTTTYIDFGASALALTTPFTISTWVYPTSTNFATILNKDRPNCGASVTQNGYSLTWESSSFRFVVNKANGPYDNTKWDSGMTVQTFPLNQWYHVVAVFPADGSTRVKIYVNNVEQPLNRYGQAQTAFTTYLNQRTWLGSGFTCSTEPGYQSSYFNGILDEPAVYSKALPASEIYAQYLEGLKGKNMLQKSRDANFNALPLDARAFFNLDENNGYAANDMNLFNNSTKMLLRFDENTGKTAFDESPYGNNGTHYGNTQLLMPLNEGTGPTANDSSPYNRNGTLYGNTSWTTGKTGSALSFDGADDYVDIAGTNLGETANGTVEAWIKPTAVTSDHPIWSKSYAGGTIEKWLILRSTGLVGIDIYDGSWHSTYSTTVLQTGQWYHIAASWGSGGMKLYINGILENSDPYTGMGYTSAYTSAIGNWKEQLGGSFDFSGIIDEVAIYSKALSQDEIKAHVSSGSAKFTDWAAGISGSALSFNGVDNYVDVADDASLRPPAISIEAWINPASVLSASIVVRSLPDYIGYQLQTEPNGKIGLVTGHNTIRSYYTAPAGSIVAGNWYHVVFTYDGVGGSDSSVKGYINGVQQSLYRELSVPSGAIYYSGTQNLRIGRRGDNIMPFNGKIDEVAIYNQVLSAGEIGTHYGARKAMFAADGIHYGNTRMLLRFDENTGTAANDQSIYGNNGSLANGAGWTTGKSGTAAKLDGINDYVNAGDIDLPSTFTLSAWVYPNSIANNPFLFNKDDGVSRSYFLNLENTGKLAGSVRNVGGTYTQYRTDSAVISTGQWQLITMTYDGSAVSDQKMKFYVNGQNYAALHLSSYDNGGIPENDSLPVKIGIWGDGVGQPFNGNIDEAGIYSKVLSPGEIRNHYFAGKAKFTDWAAGISGSALSFDGADDYVSVSDKPGARVGSANFTLSAWIKTSGDGVITDKQKNGMNYNCYGLRVSLNKAWAAAVDCGTGSCGYGEGPSYTRHAVTGTSTITDNQWHSIVFTRNNTLMSLYVDGTLEASIIEGPWDTDSTSDFRIGAQSGGAPSAFFNGIVDEVVLYNRPLSAAEIKSKYLAERAGRVDVNYFSAGNESTDSRAKDFNSVNLLMHNPVSTQIDLKKASTALGFEDFKASDCRVLADNNLFIDCLENAAIKLRFRNSLIGNTFWGTMNQYSLSDKDLRVLNQRRWDSLVLSNTDNNYWVTFNGSFKNLNSGTNIKSIPGKLEEHFIPWLDANGSLDYGILRIKVQE